MSRSALVIGGTGPTGPHIIAGLEQRGYSVTMLHSGRHELPELPETRLEHIHANPNFAESLAEAVAGRQFDVVVASYGRLRLMPQIFGGRCGQFISIGGATFLPAWSQPATEQTPRDLSGKLQQKIVEAEQELADAHAAGRFSLTHLRYPNLYGPRQLAPREWSVIRRLRDGRRRLPVLDGGLTIEARCYVRNAAQAVLAAVDRPEAAAGQFFNVYDAESHSDADRIRMIAETMQVEVELVSFPAALGRPAWYWGIGRDLRWSAEGRPPPTDHAPGSAARIADLLGHADVLPFREAIRETVEWYLANPPAPGGEQERQLADPFDYAAEDRFLAAHDDFARACAAIDFADIAFRHQYDHPKPTETAAKKGEPA